MTQDVGLFILLVDVKERDVLLTGGEDVFGALFGAKYFVFAALD